MHETAAAPAWVMLAYLLAGVCFILALRGLSSPESSRRGNRYGMLGMAMVIPTLTVALLGGAIVTETVFNWEYDEMRGRLVTLYQKGKQKQWDSETRLDWSIDVQPGSPAVGPRSRATPRNSRSPRR